MDYTQLTAARHALQGDPGLCNLFKFIASETWNRLAFAYARRERSLYETTLTQNLVFTIQSFVQEYPNLNIEILEAADEATNGNDLELILRFPAENKEFYAAIQAKKIDRNGRYYKLEHGRQIEHLIAYADSNNAMPLYLLYNSVAKPQFPYPNVQEWGCSLISAHYLRDNYYQKRWFTAKNGQGTWKWKFPHFYDLHPTHALPWHQLVCEIEKIESLESRFSSEMPFGKGIARNYLPGFNHIGSAREFVAQHKPRRFEEALLQSEEGRKIMRFEESDGPPESKSDLFRPKRRVIVEIQPR